jgi:glycine betaine catabolism A
MTPELTLDRESLRAVLAPLGESLTLPGEAYTSADVFAWEMEHFFDRSWVCADRVAELTPGGLTSTRAGSEGILLTRDDADALHGFFNVCRHRGHELLPEGGAARAGVITCPYHGWAYGLDGRLRGAPSMPDIDRETFGLVPVRTEAWLGWAFANVCGDGQGLAEHVGNLDELVRAYEPERLVLGASRDYEVETNWKLAHENYHECYHCSNIHPELCAVTPPDSGHDFEPSGVWVGGSMDLRPHAVTMSMTGESGASPLRGLDAERRRQVLYFGLFPNLLLSLHPDYVVAYRLVPMEPARTRIECRWLFAPEDAGRDGFDPAFAVDFWDLVNRQDWAAIESVQRGMASRGHRQGPLSPREATVRDFDSIVARGYLTGAARPPATEGSVVSRPS